MKKNPGSPAKAHTLSEVWKSEVQLRVQEYPYLQNQPLESLRLVHKRGGPLRIDKVGPVWVMGWWRDAEPSEKEIEEIKKFLKDQGCTRWYLHWRPRKSVSLKPRLLLESQGGIPSPWEFLENGICYEARKDQGDAFGLFFDQRSNRREIQESSQGKAVLNLFSFTCGFSVAAALGGAKRVVSVDLSRKYLDWGRVNFAKNDLAPESYEFFSMDTMESLKMAGRKSWLFDTIICDPPSFSRSKKGSFKIDRDYKELLQACWSVLEVGGTLWFSNNFEKWSASVWQRNLQECLPGAWSFKPLQKDFGGSDEQTFQKTFIVKK